MQMGWAHTAGVNLVSSCYLEVEKGLSGAGVYRKDGTFRTAIGLETGSTIVDARSAHRNPDLDNFHTEEDALMAEFSTFPLESSTTARTEASICHGDFCCVLQFETTADIGNDDRFFQLVAFNGTDAAGSEVQACGLVACAARQVASCAYGVNQTDYAADVTFDYLKLTGVFR
jgi:Vanin C-terminal domain